ncbi:hydrogenase nickel incorporation protein HypA [Candidatus Bathyarchaeota archaeon]|nr:hydrogenase nickel incorporation protein HypA [Candidatus Bathyarchaeota archaeon]
MHEWALAEAIVETAYSFLSERKTRKIISLNVVIGILQSADREVLKFALTELFKSRGIEVGELRLDEEEALLRCRSCSKTWRLGDLDLSDDVREAVHFIPEVIHAYVKCPNCNSQDLEIVSGRGIYIASMEL